MNNANVSPVPLVATELLDCLHDLTHAYKARMRAAMHALEPHLTPNETRVLLFLGRHPQGTHKDLMEYTRADKALVARSLNDLEAQGWIVRLPHPEDKRSRVLLLSERGKQLFAALRQARAEVGNQMLRGKSAAEQTQLLEALRNMVSNLDDGSADGRKSCAKDVDKLPRTTPE